MKLKSLYYIALSLLMAGTAVGCSSDDDTNYEVNNRYVMTSFGTNPNVIQVHGEMSFIDLSRGVVSREWSFPDCTFTADDSVKIATSDAEVIKVQFAEPGTYNIHLNQVFGGEVYYNLTNTGSNIYDEDIIVEVIDSLRANFSMFEVNDDMVLPVSKGALNEVTAGHVVRFTSTATGRPTTNNWAITREDGYLRTLEGTEVDFKFAAPGNYSVQYNCSSSYGADEMLVEDVITVVASTEPVTLDLVDRQAANQAGLVFSRSIGDVSTCPVTAFTVSITNNEVAQDCAVTELSVNENIVNLHLTTDIFNSDVITISYDAEVGDLMTADGMKVESFTDVPLTEFHVENLLKETSYDYSFENQEVTDWVDCNWGGSWAMYTLAISDAYAHSGTKSLKLDMEALGGAIFQLNKGGVPVSFDIDTTKKYMVGFWVYSAALGDSPEGQPNFAFYWAKSTDWGTPQMSPLATDQGKWVFLTKEISAPASPNYWWIRGNNNANSQPVTMYVDDITLTELEVRK